MEDHEISLSKIIYIFILSPCMAIDLGLLHFLFRTSEILSFVLNAILFTFFSFFQLFLIDYIPEYKNIPIILLVLMGRIFYELTYRQITFWLRILCVSINIGSLLLWTLIISPKKIIQYILATVFFFSIGFFSNFGFQVIITKKK